MSKKLLICPECKNKHFVVCNEVFTCTSCGRMWNIVWLRRLNKKFLEGKHEADTKKRIAQGIIES